MAAERRVIDLEDIPGGEVLAEVLDRYPEGFVLRRGGRPVGQFRDDRTRPSAEIEALMDRIVTSDADDVERLRNEPMSPEAVARLIELSGPPNPEQAERMHRLVEENRQASIRRQLEEIERERS